MRGEMLGEEARKGSSAHSMRARLSRFVTAGVKGEVVGLPGVNEAKFRAWCEESYDWIIDRFDEQVQEMALQIAANRPADALRDDASKDDEIIHVAMQMPVPLYANLPWSKCGYARDDPTKARILLQVAAGYLRNQLQREGYREVSVVDYGHRLEELCWPGNDTVTAIRVRTVI